MTGLLNPETLQILAIFSFFAFHNHGPNPNPYEVPVEKCPLLASHWGEMVEKKHHMVCVSLQNRLKSRPFFFFFFLIFVVCYPEAVGRFIR